MGFNEFKITSESNNPKQIEVIKLEDGHGPIIKDFVVSSLKAPGSTGYAQVKQKYGPISPTDSERGDRNSRDRRFSMNPLLKDSLSIEEEEQRVIEEKVQVRLAALSAEVRAAAEEQGYQDGLQRGYEEAYRQMRDETADRAQSFAHLVDSAEKAKDEIFKANERFLMEVVFRIARIVLLKELTVDKEYILRLAKHLIERVGVKDNIILKINPEDAKTIDLLYQGIENNFGKLSNLKIEASGQVSPGGCQIETEWNVIDAQIETQLQRIRESLTGNITDGDA